MLGVNNGLGLIGPAGSGKSVILKVLAGELEISSGDAYVYGQSLKTDVFTVSAFILYVTICSAGPALSMGKLG